tara:strand:- start:6889 stop:8223 length:1335 start_codon:yes stop_codon:yes gene_type:complete
MSTFTQSDGATNIDNILTQEANRIGADIHRNTVHTSPWIDLVKKSTFPDQMGYQLTTLIYSSALPTTDAAGGTLAGSAIWGNMGAINGDANVFGTAAVDQPLKDAAESTVGPNESDKGNINFGKELKKYNLKRAVIESPRINVEDLRFAAHRADQLRAILDLMTESTRYTWEERYRDEFDSLADNHVACKSATSVSKLETGKEGTTTAATLHAGGDADAASDGYDAAQSDTKLPEANISNALMDDIYFRLVRAGAGGNAYGRENGRPVFGFVCSSEVSRQLQIESEFRDDIRYNQSRVSELVAPLGVEKSFRGYYHLVDDLAPRFDIGSDDKLDRILPYSVSGGIISPNAAYESAPVEMAYIIHPEVFESQIPNPLSGANGLTFDPVNYKGDFKWTNIPDASLNPDGTIGFFRGILASASKPIKTKFGYAIAIARQSTTAAKGL